MIIAMVSAVLFLNFKKINLMKWFSQEFTTLALLVAITLVGVGTAKLNEIIRFRTAETQVTSYMNNVYAQSFGKYTVDKMNLTVNGVNKSILSVKGTNKADASVSADIEDGVMTNLDTNSVPFLNDYFSKNYGGESNFKYRVYTRVNYENKILVVVKPKDTQYAKTVQDFLQLIKIHSMANTEVTFIFLRDKKDSTKYYNSYTANNPKEIDMNTAISRKNYKIAYIVKPNSSNLSIEEIQVLALIGGEQDKNKGGL